jgi:hypothetical protein
VPDATVIALVGHETLAMSSHDTHVGTASLESLESAVASLLSLGLAPQVATPASNDEDEGDDESSGTLKLRFLRGNRPIEAARSEMVGAGRRRDP